MRGTVWWLRRRITRDTDTDDRAATGAIEARTQVDDMHMFR